MTYKTFSVGDVLTALDVQTIQDQSVIRVASAAERDAIPAPADGMTVYRTDTRRPETYRGAAGWVAVPKIITGSFQLPVQAAGANQTVAVTFPAGVFTAPPNVHITPSNGRVTASLVNGSVTTTGATLGFDNWSPGAVGSPHTVYWTAIGV